jgi:hypothetical protein
MWYLLCCKREKECGKESIMEENIESLVQGIKNRLLHMWRYL